MDTNINISYPECLEPVSIEVLSDGRVKVVFETEYSELEVILPANKSEIRLNVYSNSD